MQLEWFREHKSFVYWVLLPVTVVTMAVWGVGSGQGSLFGGSGPTVRYTLGKKEYSLSPSEVMDYRLKVSKFVPGRGVSSLDIGEHALEVTAAKQAGFELGTEEGREILRRAVKNAIARKEPGAPPPTTVNEELYGKLLTAMQMSPNDFEQVTREFALSAKYAQFASSVNVGDGQLFTEYCRDKQVVRIRYQEFKSSDYLKNVPQPTDDKVKSFYNTNKDNKTEDLKSVLYTQPTLAAELIGFDTEKFLASLKPTEDELKAFYERRKAIDFVEKPVNPPKAGEPPAPVKFKPYETVKADVETKWRDEKKFQASSELGTIKNELEKAQTAWKEEQAKKPAAEQKPFSVQDWVAKKNLPYLVYWTTPEQTQDVYKKGKKEFKATDAEWVEGIFFWAHPDAMAGRGGDTEKMKEFFKRQFEDWTQPAMIDPARMEKGMVIARKIAYTDSKLKSLDDAKPAIIERLKILDAVDLANKDAQKAHDDWENGKDLPKLDSMLEVKADSTKAVEPIVRKYFTSPKGVGEVLGVAEGPEKPANPEEPQTPNKIFYVGFPVEIQLPTNVTFEKDTQWDREQTRSQIAQSTGMYIQETMRHSIGKVTASTLKDPPLYDAYGRGDE